MEQREEEGTRGMGTHPMSGLSHFRVDGRPGWISLVVPSTAIFRLQETRSNTTETRDAQVAKGSFSTPFWPWNVAEKKLIF